MARPKNNPAETPETAAAPAQEPLKVEATFTKAQLIGSKHFQHRRDVIRAMLDDDKRYTIKQAQAAIDEFFGKKVQ